MVLTDEFKGYLQEVFRLLKENIKYLKEIYPVSNELEKDFIACRIFSYRQIVFSMKELIKKHNIREEEIGLDQLDLNSGFHV